MAKPEVTIKAGNIQLTVWNNTITHKTKGDITVQSITINKSYKDNNSGEWKTSNSFTYGELKYIEMVIKEAYRQKYLKSDTAQSTPDDF